MTIKINHTDFYELRDDANFVEIDTVYEIQNDNETESTFGITVDGIGFFFYETLAELQANH